MAFSTKKNIEKCKEILASYSGPNAYIRFISGKFKNGDDDVINDFNIEYILTNIDFSPKEINKIVKIAEWYAQKKVETKTWDVSFVPKKIEIVKLIGETSGFYNCDIRYKQNMLPKMSFIPKNALIGNLITTNYKDLYVDFSRYDKLSSLRDPNRKMKEHQKEGVKFLLSRKKCVLADEMGLGKSCTLTVAAIEGNFDSILIICPASLKTNWKNELLWYVPEKDISIIDGYLDKNKSELEKYLGYGIGKSGKNIKELQEEAKKMGKWQDNRFVIVNYDILDEFCKPPKSRSKANIEKAFNESPMLQYISRGKSLVIIDEAHRLSNKDSDRYKTVQYLIKNGNPDSIYLSTGTPITNNPENFFNLLKFLGDPITNDWNYYVNRYCNAKKILLKGEFNRCLSIFLKENGFNSRYDMFKPDWERFNEYLDKHGRKITTSNGASNLDELLERTSHIYLRRTKDILNDMPQKRVHELMYDLTPTQKEEYNRLWEEYETAKLEADPSLELNKELLEGAIYRKYLSNQMIPYTIKLIDQIISNGEKVVVATCYDDELYTLKEHYGDICVVYNGKMNAKEKDAAYKKFVENPEVKVFFGNIIAAGVGINLQNSHNVIFNSFSYVPGECFQFEDRCWRIGSTQDVNIYYQMFRETEYERIWNIVLRKKMVINQVIKTEDEKK